MDCVNCQGKCWRSGRQKNGLQRYYCPTCRKYQQARYQYKAYSGSTDSQIKSLVRESVCIRGIARVLGIARGTVLDRIRGLAATIMRPASQPDQVSLEVDELWTYVSRKDNEYWVAYAINRGNSAVVDFVVGKRTKSTLKQLIDRLLCLKPKTIRTDKLTLYERLIPKRMHRAGSICINRIERKNLSIRTHLKRLSRQTICFSRSLLMLESCLLVYFWG
ncbi:IS1 family transposase [Puia dinghuensis]|uniref:IS1 family transposase n=1 Tax=Puia dinghuensis TaxID=1792502 RepID=UPI0016691803